MAKGFYIGSANLARTGKKLYLGNGNNLACKAKKMYIGDANSVARLAWSGEQTIKYLKAMAYPQARNWASNGGTTVGDYAIFGGGSYSSTSRKTVTAYNSSLTAVSASDLTNSHTSTKTVSTPNKGYALFGGDSESVVNSYNTSLTKSNAPALSGSYSAITGNVGNYALFISHSNSYPSTAYDNSLTARAPSSSPKYAINIQGGAQSDAVEVGNYCIMMGSSLTSQACSINTSLTISWEISASGSTLYNVRGTYVEGYALFAGGKTGGSAVKSNVGSFNTSLTFSQVTPLSSAREYIAAISFGDKALFAGGGSGNVYSSSYPDTVYASVDTYDKSLTRSLLTSGLSKARAKVSVAVVNKYALFVGGAKAVSGSHEDYDTIDVYVYD